MGDFDFGAASQGFEFAPQASDPFADPFAAPQASGASKVKEDPFLAPGAPVFDDPFSASAHDEEVSDPFVSKPAYNQFSEDADSFSSNPQDPFAVPVQEDPFNSQPQATILSAVQPAFVPEIEEVDEEELERRRLRDQEHQERMHAIFAKEEAERSAKDDRRQTGSDDLRRWQEDRQKQIKLRRQMNRDQQEANLKARKDGNSSWKKVASMVDFKDANKDKSRFKGVLLSRKNEG